MSSCNYTPNNRISVTHQPQASAVNLASLDLKQPISAFPFHEKSLEASLENGQFQDHRCEHHHHGGGTSSEEQHHHSCHNNRMKQLFWPALIILLALGGLFAWSCVNSYGWSDWGVGDLVGRAVTDSTTNGNNAFTHKKLYLIVIFVGLLVVLILGIMLTACCCKSSFKNPLCCPCYLCACCGGLVCLECIGCGLCAEGVSQM